MVTCQMDALWFRCELEKNVYDEKLYARVILVEMGHTGSGSGQKDIRIIFSGYIACILLVWGQPLYVPFYVKSLFVCSILDNISPYCSCIFA